jgi:hypothetical protein
LVLADCRIEVDAITRKVQSVVEKFLILAMIRTVAIAIVVGILCFVLSVGIPFYGDGGPQMPFAAGILSGILFKAILAGVAGSMFTFLLLKLVTGETPERKGKIHQFNSTGERLESSISSTAYKGNSPYALRRE